ncbi:hypothetical protein O6H91_19G040100 [Diphasiastrum complanatum]|uniref:Uncharacterized protein n=1 Tax=Diphasiastrum complanatum TaxID=34168 RepID=A0ACC2AV55_DIPCM|nr:hypothetical protein O6H91_19G040100 [Diphasiastrum complanatum]
MKDQEEGWLSTIPRPSKLLLLHARRNHSPIHIKTANTQAVCMIATWNSEGIGGCHMMKVLFKFFLRVLDHRRPHPTSRTQRRACGPVRWSVQVAMQSVQVAWCQLVPARLQPHKIF